MVSSATQPPPLPSFAPPVGGKVSVSLFGEISPCSFSLCVSDLRAVFLTSQRNFEEKTRVLSWGTKKLFVLQSYEEIAARILESAAAPVSRDSHYVYGLFGLGRLLSFIISVIVY